MRLSTLRRIGVAAFVAVTALGLGACEQMMDILPDSKKPLPGERKPLFPEGVPGVTQGVPPELMKNPQANAATDPAGAEAAKESSGEQNAPASGEAAPADPSR